MVPEKGYAAHAETLVRKGFRLVVVEQTETPDQLAERNRASSGPKDKVVMREKVSAWLTINAANRRHDVWSAPGVGEPTETA